MSQNRTYSRNEIAEPFRKLPTYDSATDTIKVTDLEGLLQALKFIYTAEQLEQYHNYWTELFDRIIPLELLVATFGCHDDHNELMRIHVTALDADKNGYIDENEFKTLMKVLLLHNPNLPKVDYAQFVKEADANKDGKISIDEAVEWFVKGTKI
ncbi:parvalbumin alpha [Folsomia candida]|uniref:Parvalbumin beta n=1 Tax=Folsomia candida TaxID=158441 RepID=A0A226DMB1_FOLCA|nr:parvalbumin alpha [Folsomia candida]OXA46319.1 Parvalbumin beta [Folsomia candida]